MKRPLKETYESDLVNRPAIRAYKRDWQRDLQKRPTKETCKRDL